MNALTIKESYKVSKKEFSNYFYKYGNEPVIIARNWTVMKLEWATHNGLYALGLWREHTKDVDFEYPQNRWLTLCYIICGAIMWPFIK